MVAKKRCPAVPFLVAADADGPNREVNEWNADVAKDDVAAVDTGRARMMRKCEDRKESMNCQ